MTGGTGWPNYAVEHAQWVGSGWSGVTAWLVRFVVLGRIKTPKTVLFCFLITLIVTD